LKLDSLTKKGEPTKSTVQL